MRNALILLWVAAAVLGIVAVIVVFYPSGSYQPVIVQGPGTTSFSNLPTSTPTSTPGTGLPSSTPTSTTPPPGTFASTYSSPYPVSWTDAGVSYEVTAAGWNGNELSISLSIQMGTSPACVPIDLRLITDESGDQVSPSSPAGPNFIFPDTQTCNGTPGATYSESLSFTVPSNVPSPFLLTTGGTANTFFNLATSTSGGVDIALPSNSG